MTTEISASPFIRKNVLVDPFMTDVKSKVALEPIRYLLRAQVKTDQSFDPSPGRGIYKQFCLIASAQCQFMSLFRSISFQPTIASEFSANRGFMNPDIVRYFSLVMSCFQKYVNLVSLFSGKLRIGSHQCSFDVVV